MSANPIIPSKRHSKLHLSYNLFVLNTEQSTLLCTSQEILNVENLMKVITPLPKSHHTKKLDKKPKSPAKESRHKRPKSPSKKDESPSQQSKKKAPAEKKSTRS